ncbi:hypothetical protein PHMEG_00037489 [Phytophthora megakarya]|uniref:Eukaryotic/viral aspartic protease n=1 Tax=Phytophthora megakarya TaxID=4795 RepID=A0A225UJU0_9STRA|nr:hypothetical protein PHMEG_00037489 [Phytophthora megakarya]
MAPIFHIRNEGDEHATERLVHDVRAEFARRCATLFNQPAKARYYSGTRWDKENACDYLNRLNEYARNARVQFKNGDVRQSTTWNISYAPVTTETRRNVYHVLVNDLEDMITHILQRREQTLSREPCVRTSHSRGNGHRREHDRAEDARSGYRRDRNRDGSHRRDESPYQPRVTLAGALSDFVADLNSEASPYRYEDADEPLDKKHQANEDRCSERYSEEGYASDGDYGHAAAANDNERCSVAEGAFARSANTHHKGARGHFNNNRGHGRDIRVGRKQYGPCAACGGMSHSVHYCFKRCKLCKQVHDAGKCEAFVELTNLLRMKVDKRDLTPELQDLVLW